MRILGVGNAGPHPVRTAPAARIAAPVDIRALRRHLGMSQAGFARRFGFRLDALKRWERGSATPRGETLVLLNLIERNPQVVLMSYWTPARRRSSRSISR
jgi:putative transcriptional regulator